MRRGCTEFHGEKKKKTKSARNTTFQQRTQRLHTGYFPISVVLCVFSV